MDSKAAREAILDRIRAALPGDGAGVRASYETIVRAYQRTGTLSPEACRDLFIDRLLDYDTEVICVQAAAEIKGAVAGALRQAGESRLLVGAALDTAWLPEDTDCIVDQDLGTEAINGAEAVLTSCEVAVASTGTIFLVHGGPQGRRVATLLPDHHICVIRHDQVYETVPEAMARLKQLDSRPVTTISGPSATSDIEMTRIRGVHGPRRLSVILYEG